MPLLNQRPPLKIPGWCCWSRMYFVFILPPVLDQLSQQAVGLDRVAQLCFLKLDVLVPNQIDMDQQPPGSFG